MTLKGKRVLVTGGAGFIGSHTVDALLRGGAKVAIIDNFLTGQRRNINPRAKVYRLNIASPKVQAVFKKFKPDYVYHFAFYVLVPKSSQNPLLDSDSIIGSINLLRAARETGVKKFIFSSSGFLYGNTKILPTKEAQPVIPVSPYVVAKFAVESYLQYFKSAFGLPYVVLRYSAVYGPRQVTGAMADYIAKLAHGRQSEIWGKGDKTRDYVYVEDVVRANLGALKVPVNHPNPVFNIGTGNETTLLALYKTLAKMLGREAKPIFLPDRPGEQYRYALDSSKARKFLGWAPRWSLARGLAVTLKTRKLI